MTETNRPLRCAVVGAGRMGRHHARVYSQLKETELIAVVDSDLQRARSVTGEYGGQASQSVSDLLNAGVEAVTVAVPTNVHGEVAAPILKRGIACLIEKPLAANVDQARHIAELARKTGTILQVGHIERYNPAVRALAEQTDLVPRFIEVHRVSPMSFRSIDVGVVLDMMIHDLDVLLMLVGEEPMHINACAVGVLGEAEDVCNARLEFPSGCVANVTASRLAMKTERKIRIVAEDAYISIDYARKSGVMIRRTANAEQLDELRAQLRAGVDLSDLDYTDLVRVEPLQVDDEDQLAMQLRDFVAAVRGGRRPAVDVEAGFAAVRTAERIVAAATEHTRRVRRVVTENQ